jgi:hypothetical protein
VPPEGWSIGMRQREIKIAGDRIGTGLTSPFPAQVAA